MRARFMAFGASLSIGTRGPLMQRALAVDRAAEAVEDAAEEPRPGGDEDGAALGADGIARRDAGQPAQRHAAHGAVQGGDHLGVQARVRAHGHQVAQGAVESGHFEAEAR